MSTKTYEHIYQAIVYLYWALKFLISKLKKIEKMKYQMNGN